MTDTTRTAGARAIRTATADTGVLLLFAGTLFVSALLLFSVQPVFAKMVLPRLGATREAPPSKPPSNSG